MYRVIATFFNFAKASIGSGSFALPFAVLQAGVLFGSAGMIVLGVIRWGAWHIMCLFVSPAVSVMSFCQFAV